MTAKQLGECLEYSEPLIAINKLVKRNEYLKNKEFSVLTKLVSTDGKKYDTRIFTEDGIYEITMLAKTEKAKEFRKIRTVEINNDPYFVGKDVADILGYGNCRQALKTNVDAEDKGVHSVDTLKGQQKMTVINESGLYSLILSSKLPQAKKFKHWVTSDKNTDFLSNKPQINPILSFCKVK